MYTPYFLIIYNENKGNRGTYHKDYFRDFVPVFNLISVYSFISVSVL